MPKKKPKSAAKVILRSSPHRRRRRRRVKMPDAMRARGLDELELADKYGHLVDRLDKPKSRQDKLLLDTLKEWGKLLEAYPTGRATPTGPEPVQIVLDVPRPVRDSDSTDDSAT